VKECTTKKEIKDIMQEMESLSERQIATTLTEETLKELMASNGFNATKAGFRAIPTCTPDCSDCVKTIDFCLKTSVSKCFTVNVDDRLTTIQFNSSLFSFTDPCPCNVICSPGVGCPDFCIALYPLRVVGCIQFRAFTGNALGDSFGGDGAGQSSGLVTGAISVEGSLCVNNIVSYQQCPPTISETQPKFIPATSLTATVSASQEQCEDCSTVTGSACDNTVVKFVGSFKLPDVLPTASCPNTPCPTPSCPPCCS
jgi:hypothetical protein